MTYCQNISIDCIMYLSIHINFTFEQLVFYNCYYNICIYCIFFFNYCVKGFNS